MQIGLFENTTLFFQLCLILFNEWPVSWRAVYVEKCTYGYEEGGMQPLFEKARGA